MPQSSVPLPFPLKASPFTVAQALSIGVGQGRLRGKDLERPFHGIRVVRSPASNRAGVALDGEPASSLGAHPDLMRRCAALLVAMPAGAFFTHTTAAGLWPLPLPTRGWERHIHVSVRPPQRPPRRPSVVGHESTDLRAVVMARSTLPVVDPATLFCQLGSMLLLPDLVAIGDALVLQPVFQDWSDDRPWVMPEQLQERVDCFRGRGKARAAKALGLIRPGAESRPETLLRLAILEAGLPEPEVNVPVLDPAGRFIGRGDLVYRRWKVVVEYDGEQHRTDNRQFDRDVRRLDDFAAHGWRVVRITGRTFADRREAMDRVARALIAGGWRP
ncbi:endonuclease domain-containing protein [Nakamurella sp. GG22]